MDNGLTHICLNTKAVEAIVKSENEIFEKFSSNGWFIAYLFHRVIIGSVKDNQFLYHEMNDYDMKLGNIIKLRLFNENSELFVWRSKLGNFFSRYRTDEEGEISEAIDSHQILFGTRANIVGGNYLKLTEARGTEIILPVECVNINPDEINFNKKRLAIHTRSYLGQIEEAGVATFTDVRFVKFEKYREDKQ